jgi:glycine/D-amino acid oxidase-like deaminating enzyme
LGGVVDVDILIVGGGAQGLWLLNDLTKHHYRAVLLEHAELGGGQTCHSHGLIHRGHYYDDVDMMIILNAAAQFWEAFVEENGIAKLNPSKALAGFGPGTQVERHTYFWKTAGLKFDTCSQKPDVLESGAVKYLFQTEEFSLDPSEVVAGLARNIDHAIYKLDGDDNALRFVQTNTSIQRVEAALVGEHVDFRPKFVVLSAGVGNFHLLEKIGAEKNKVPIDTPVQAQRKSHMMVLRGRDLPMMTAVFPIRGGLQGVFLCPRLDADNELTVWLCSDHNSFPFHIASDGTPSLSACPSQEWVKRMLISLGSTAPGLFSGTPDTLEVALYTGLTSERNFGTGQHMTDLFIDSFGFENLLAIWPTKLTMTPFASNVAIRFIRPVVPEPAGEWPRVERDVQAPSPKVSVEMWRREPLDSPYSYKTPWVPYSEFREQWHISS